MTRAGICRCAWVVAFIASVALAQTPAAAPAFEVAVIKPSMPMTEAIPLLKEGKLKVGMTVDKTRVDVGFMTIKDLIVAAYKVKPFQIAGPDWLAMDRFDIQAKMPDGANENQVPRMLQSMLAERFGMAIHSEQREQPVYALIVGKSGSKLQPSVEPDPAPAPGALPGMATVTPSANGTFTAAGGPTGKIKMTMGPAGMHMEMLNANIATLTDLLTSILGRPVLDKTDLPGHYQVALDIPLEDVQNVARAIGAGPASAAPSANAPDPSGSSMFQAVEQLGLKLDSRSDRVETIVIDHIDKTPTGN